MSKCYNVESCRECPGYSKEKLVDMCEIEDKEIPDAFEFPDWCPLDDY